MSKWVTLGKSHINLDRITAFRQDGRYLVLQDAAEQPFNISDETGEWYRALCAVVGVAPMAAQAGEVKQDET